MEIFLIDPALETDRWFEVKTVARFCLQVCCCNASVGTEISQHTYTYTYNTQDLRSTEIFDGSAIPPAPAVPDTNTTYTVNAVNQLLSTLAPDRASVYDDDGNMTQGYTKLQRR